MILGVGSQRVGNSVDDDIRTLLTDLRVIVVEHSLMASYPITDWEAQLDEAEKAKAEAMLKRIDAILFRDLTTAP